MKLEQLMKRQKRLKKVWWVLMGCLMIVNITLYFCVKEMKEQLDPFYFEKQIIENHKPIKP